MNHWKSKERNQRVRDILNVMDKSIDRNCILTQCSMRGGTEVGNTPSMGSICKALEQLDQSHPPNGRD